MNQVGYIHLTDDYEKLARQRATQLNSEAHLYDMAGELNEDYFNFTLPPFEIKFVFTLKRTYGNHKAKRNALTRETFEHRIRISHRMTVFEDWLTEVVTMHELVHCLCPNHGYLFWKWVSKHPDSALGEQILHAGEPPSRWLADNFAAGRYDFDSNPEYNLEKYLIC